ncbi:MAG: 2-C-methyl-D-erythritol 4-phosphate cytidylyltransferase [Planctomycetaceae bacterium]|jgi:2-C-methyl-D-erythritol 4-phosphate cytidylyltransferase
MPDWIAVRLLMVSSSHNGLSVRTPNYRIIRALAERIQLETRPQSRNHKGNREDSTSPSRSSQTGRSGNPLQLHAWLYGSIDEVSSADSAVNLHVWSGQFCKSWKIDDHHLTANREPIHLSKFAVIVAAAGRSSRFGSRSPREKKVFRELNGRPVWLRSVEAFSGRTDVAQTIVIVAPDDLDWFKEKYAPNLGFLDLDIVAGGAERADSVMNALARVQSDIDFVAIHDAARPLVVKQWIDELFQAAETHGAAIPATAISSTLKRVDGESIVETVPRERLFAAQTPQVFRRELILEAYAKRGDFEATDESSLVERLGHAVHIVKGSPMNLKITTQEDLKIAGALLGILPRAKGLDSLAPPKDNGLDWLLAGK